MAKYSEHTSKYNIKAKENFKKFFDAKNAMEKARAERDALRKSRMTPLEAAHYARAEPLKKTARTAE